MDDSQDHRHEAGASAAEPSPDDAPTQQFRPDAAPVDPFGSWASERERREPSVGAFQYQATPPPQDEPDASDQAADSGEAATRLQPAVPGEVTDDEDEATRVVPVAATPDPASPEAPAPHAASPEAPAPEAPAPADPDEAPTAVRPRTDSGTAGATAFVAPSSPPFQFARPAQPAAEPRNAALRQPPPSGVPQPAPAGNPDDTAAPDSEPHDGDAFDPMSDTLHPAMATNTPTGSYQGYPAPVVQAGDVFAERYRLEQQLAQRGGTLTWRAFDQKLSRSVLVHLLGADDPRTPDVLEAARKAAFATDSRFLRVLDAVAGENPGEPSLVVCEFAPGESLERLLRQGPLSALEAGWVVRELADALAAMHTEGLFHQRINPDTVIITATGNVKIVGFLIEAAMYPDAEEGTLAWSEREHADVVALGKVLYACLVTRWPTPREQLLDADGEPTLTWGLPAAPMDGRGWLTPRQIRSGVSPALDVICDQVLSDSPRHNEMPLRTASQVALALSKVLGTADAADDLERRMRYPVVPVSTDTEARRTAADAVHRSRREAPGLDSTARMAAVSAESRAADEAGAGSAALPPSRATTRNTGRATASDSADDEDAPYSPSTPVGDDEDDPTTTRPVNDLATGSSGRPQRTRQSRPRPRRWLLILVALVLVALVAGLLRLVSRNDSGNADANGSTADAGQVLAISTAKDFDPTADGGNGQEDPAQVKLATDKNPATAWQSVTYLNDARLGKLKPGVGLVLDLGEKKQVGTVKLTLQGQPTGVQLRVPTDAGVGQAPMTSQSQWTTVASNTKAGTSVELKPEQAVQTRFLLVYLTSLPSIGSNHYRGGIAEVEVLS